jgi:holo-[acyl-carrier protein] synthase
VERGAADGLIGMATRIGIDLVPLDRVRDMVENSAVPQLDRMLSEEELTLSHSTSVLDVAGVAGRIAAKEAVFKVFHAAREALPWLTIEILKGRGGWPEVRLSGRAAMLATDAQIEQIAVSITHDGSYAVAVAVASLSAE